MELKHHLPHISTFLLTFGLIFVVSGFLFPKIARADPGYCVNKNGQYVPGIGQTVCGANNFGTWTPGVPPANIQKGPLPNPPSGAGEILKVATNILLAPLGWLALLILKIATLITALGGMILNYVVQFTIVEMSQNIKGVGAIDTAWTAIRNVANMGFIFVLLYAAIKTILGLGSDTKKLIVNIVIVAILINFSLFFTKVVIDASNVLSTFFYDAIAPGSLTNTQLNTGLSGKMMEPLGLTTLWDTGSIGVLKTDQNIIIGVMGTIVSLIVAFVFFAVAIMFVIRFVVLIFVLILSPLAFIAFILPKLESYKKQWIEALIGQAFFAPIYFMLTWIVISISTGLFKTGAQGGALATALGGAVGIDGNVTPPPPSSIALLMNFIIMIVFLIASLIIAKKWADRAGNGVPSLTKWATGFAGGATLGMAGVLGRGTIGRAGAALGENEKLKEAATKGGAGGMAARLALATGRKTGSASFDVRGTPLSDTLGAGQAQKGGFAEFKKKQVEAKTKFAASLAPSVKAQYEVKKKHKELEAEYIETVKEFGKDSPQAVELKKLVDESKINRDTLLGNKEEVSENIKGLETQKKKRVDDIKNSEQLKQAETEERSAFDTVSRLKAEVGSAKDDLKADKIKELETAKIALEEIKKKASEARKRVREETERITDSYDSRKKVLEKTEIKPASETRKDKFADTVEKSQWAKFRGYNYDAAAQIRKGKKTAKELVDDLLKETGEKSAALEEKPETPPETPPA